MKKNNRHTAIHNEEIQDILSNSPHYLIRYGSTIIGLIFMTLFVGSFFFRYPDVVNCKIAITTPNPPVYITSKVTGKIEQMLKRDKQQIKRGDTLAIIENSSTIQNCLDKITKRDYVIISPTNGKLLYNNIWNAHQNIMNGDKIFAVIYENDRYFIGKVNIPMNIAYKVKIGQEVKIKLDNYPYLEYGCLSCKISSISTIIDNNSYSAIVILPKTLETSYHKIINFTGYLSGTAEIITNNISIGERLLSPFKYIFKE